MLNLMVLIIRASQASGSMGRLLAPLDLQALPRRGVAKPIPQVSSWVMIPSRKQSHIQPWEVRKIIDSKSDLVKWICDRSLAG